MATFFTDKSVYEYGEPIRVDYEGAITGSYPDWIAIYTEGVTPTSGGVASLQYAYIEGTDYVIFNDIEDKVTDNNRVATDSDFDTAWNDVTKVYYNEAGTSLQYLPVGNYSIFFLDDGGYNSVEGTSPINIIVKEKADNPLDETLGELADAVREKTGATSLLSFSDMTGLIKNLTNVKSIEQTSVSTEDSGENVLTVTYNNGDTSTIIIRNGSKGSKGDTGDTGDKGQDGISVTKTEINDKGELEITLSNNETPVNLGNIKGSRGEQGEPGKSAYQIWLEEGNTGTEQDFTESLKGQAGESPFINANGYWQIGNTVTNVKAEGPQGDPITITNIEQSNLPGGGSVITFSDGTTLSVYNGPAYTLTQTDIDTIVAQVINDLPKYNGEYIEVNNNG